MEQHAADNCKCHKQVLAAQQSVSDMDFDRGIWNAAIYNEKERVRGFVSKGKSMDRDNCNYTALHYAARNGNVEICKILLNEGHADINAQTNGGVTPLHRAALMGHGNLIRLFIEEADAKLDMQDEDGKTALHRAAERGQLEVCRLLIGKQVKLKHIADKKGNIPYEYLPDNANDDLKLLLKP